MTCVVNTLYHLLTKTGLFGSFTIPNSYISTVSILCGIDLFTRDKMARYQAQVSLISTNLFPLYGTELEIGTVDGMQGREKEAILISLVRSNEKV